LGEGISRDPMEEKGGVNLYNFVNNACLNRCDFLGLTSIGQILDAFFAYSGGDQSWMMYQYDPYTEIVKNWTPVKQAVEAAKADLKLNCSTWEKSHKTDFDWGAQPHTTPPVPNAWQDVVLSPPGTDPDTAARAFALYLTTGYQTESLATSAIGSFTLFVTVDEIDCCAKKATLDIWMYNRMSRQSFGRFADWPVFAGCVMANQYMWWNWSEEYNFSTGASGGSGGSGGSW
jgi:hypothetical protein